MKTLALLGSVLGEGVGGPAPFRTFRSSCLRGTGLGASLEQAAGQGLAWLPGGGRGGPLCLMLNPVAHNGPAELMQGKEERN